MHGILVAMAAALIATTASADAVCDCRADCAGRADPTAGMSYEDDEHRLWYEVRFWTGACHSDLWWCFSGPSWYDVMSRVLAQGAEADRPMMCERLYALGVALGHEWARDNDIRRIHTADLEDWRETLLDAPDPVAAISAVEALTAARLK